MRFDIFFRATSLSQIMKALFLYGRLTGFLAHINKGPIVGRHITHGARTRDRHWTQLVKNQHLKVRISVLLHTDIIISLRELMEVKIELISVCCNCKGESQLPRTQNQNINLSLSYLLSHFQKLKQRGRKHEISSLRFISSFIFGDSGL